MRKLHFFSTLVALSLATSTLWAKPASADENGKLPLKFSVSSTKQVYFSQGNLQYQASTGTWRFAENQYDFVGDASRGNVYENSVKCNNANISSTYTGWIDLFGWGTKNNPTNTSTTYSDYSWQEWGENAISNGGDDGSFGWRTLTSDEWAYMVGGSGASSVRTGCSTVNGTTNARCTKATILTDGTAPNKDIQGLIIFPDCYTGGTPSGVTWGRINPTNNSTYDRNYPTSCTTAGWKALEAAGCVFLPSAGRRGGTTVTVYDDGANIGCYTSSTELSSANAARWQYINRTGVYANYAWTNDKPIGRSVRLVKYAGSESYPPVATIAEAPAAISDLAYTGSAQTLTTAGTAGTGTMMYSLDGSNYSSTLPKGTNAGTYTVYYKAGGDCFTSSATQSVVVTIEQADLDLSGITITANNVSFTGSAQALLSVEGSIVGTTIYYSENGVDWTTSIPEKSAVGEYPVWYKIVPSNSNYKTFVSDELTATIAYPTVSEDASPASVLSALYNDNNPIETSLRVNRTIYADGEYNTICLPFNVTNLATSPLAGYERLKAFKGATVTGSGQNLFIDIFVEDATAIEAGVPYLITFPAGSGNLTSLIFDGIQVTTTSPSEVSANGVTFRGIFGPTHIYTYEENTAASRNEDYLFVGSGSQLFWPNDDGSDMPGFRAYFIVDRAAGSPISLAPKGTRARIMDAPMTTTGIDELNATICTKLIENGQLYIIKNGVKYNAQGIIVK